jgi:hypothetical protein
MGGISSRSQRQGENLGLLQSLEGIVLRKSRNRSPYESFLLDTLYHLAPVSPKSLSKLYVVKEAKDLELKGLLPTFKTKQSGQPRFIVRPLSKQFVERAFTPAETDLQQDVESVYSMLSFIILVTSLAMVSYNVSEEKVKEFKKMASGHSASSTAEPTERSGTRFLALLQKYSSQMYSKERNSRATNILFDVSNYPIIQQKMMRILEKQYVPRKKKTEEEQITSSGGGLFHLSLIQAMDRFSVCSSSRSVRGPSLRALVGLFEKSSSGGVDLILTKITEMLRNSSVKRWLEAHPPIKRRLEKIMYGMAKVTDITTKEETLNFREIVFEIFKEMKKHIEEVCEKNVNLRSFSAVTGVLSVSKEGVVTYSKEANRNVVQIFKRFEQILLEMQSKVQKSFSKIFEFSKIPLSDTISIDAGDGKTFLCVKKSVMTSSTADVQIADVFLEIISEYSEYILKTYSTLKSTITLRTKVI